MDSEGTVEKQWWINIHHKSPYDNYCGRGGPYGNPFTHLPGKTLAQFKVDSREEAVEAYEPWVRSQPELVAKIKRELKGKVLGCFCYPRDCHCRILHKISEEE